MRVGQDSYYELIEQPRTSSDEIEMPVGERIERAWINGDGCGLSFPVLHLTDSSLAEIDFTKSINEFQERYRFQ